MFLEINDIVFLFVVSEDNIGIFEGLIEEYYVIFFNLYFGRLVILKMYYMVYFLLQMLR